MRKKSKMNLGLLKIRIKQLEAKIAKLEKRVDYLCETETWRSLKESGEY